MILTGANLLRNAGSTWQRPFLPCLDKFEAIKYMIQYTLHGNWNSITHSRVGRTILSKHMYYLHVCCAEAASWCMI